MTSKLRILFPSLIFVSFLAPAPAATTNPSSCGTSVRTARSFIEYAHQKQAATKIGVDDSVVFFGVFKEAQWPGFSFALPQFFSP